MLNPTSQLDRTRTAATALNQEIHNLFDVGDVPETSGVARQIEAALNTIYNSLETLSTEARYAEAMSSPGPIVYVVPEKDMRNWPTGDGRRAGTHPEIIAQGSRQAARMNSLPFVESPSEVQSRKALSAQDYAEALYNATSAPVSLS